MISRIDRRVFTQPEGIELIHPGVITAFGTARQIDILELGQWLGIEGPAFRAVLPRRLRAVQRPLAERPVEARHVATGQGHPSDTVAIDIHAAGGETLDRIAVGIERQFIILDQGGNTGIITRHQSHDRTGIAEVGPPHRPIRCRRHGVKTGVDALVP